LQKCGRDRLVGVTVLGVGVTGLTGRGSICKGREWAWQKVYWSDKKFFGAKSFIEWAWQHRSENLPCLYVSKISSRICLLNLTI